MNLAKRITIIERREEGPTIERLAKAQNHFHIGDDKQGTRIYQFVDTPMDRLYSRLTRAAATKDQRDNLRDEYVALAKYRRHFIEAGKEAPIASVDPNSIFASNPSQRAGMPMADFQLDNDLQWRRARNHIGHQPGIVVDNVVCSENLLEVAGFAIGYTSIGRAREAATSILRDSARKLAKMWGIG